MNDFIQNNLVYLLAVMSGAMALLLIGFIVVFFKIKKMKKANEKFFSGKNGKDLEELIVRQVEKIEKNEKDIKELFDAYEKIFKIASKGVQKVGIVRYNPFGDVGGKQSFVLALLDGENSGVVISSLQTREGLRLFVKTIINKQCIDYPLTDEEKDAIKKAKVDKGKSRV